MNAVVKDLISRKSEIQKEIELVFKANMTITDWDVPEADDKEAAKILLDIIQEELDNIKADVEAGKYDYYQKKENIMSSHKNKEHLESIKNAIDKTNNLSEDQKSESMKRLEEWIVEDKAFGTLKNELMEVSMFFEEVFSELGIK